MWWGANLPLSSHTFSLDKLVFWVYFVSKSTKGTLASVQKPYNVRLYDATSGLFLCPARRPPFERLGVVVQ